MIKARDLAADQSRQRGSKQLNTAQCEKLLKAVSQNMNAPWTPAKQAREAGLSPDYFSRLFKHTFGLPPREWLVREKMRKAAQLLLAPRIA